MSDRLQAVEHVNGPKDRKKNDQNTSSGFIEDGLSFLFGHLVTSLLFGLPHLSVVYTFGANTCIGCYISALKEKANQRTGLNPLQRCR